jgi:hypothetical protein
MNNKRLPKQIATAKLEGKGEDHRKDRIKANSHIPCHSHAVPLSCCAIKGLDCVFSI